MKIINSSPEDIDCIFQLFDSAIAYQQKNGYNLWPQFGRELIETEIREKRHWKIMAGDKIACIFSVIYSDPEIWGKEKDKDPAVYLHRITVNPAFKGRSMMSLVKEWAITHARQLNIAFVRMDTWGNNENLRDYYISCGFKYIGRQYLIREEGAPEHYGGSVVSLFEILV